MGNPFKKIQKGTKKFANDVEKEFKSLGKEIQQGTKKTVKEADEILKQVDKQAQKAAGGIEKHGLVQSVNNEFDKIINDIKKLADKAAAEPEQANNVVSATEITEENCSDEMTIAYAKIIGEDTGE